MLERLRSAYRGCLTTDRRLVADPVLYDDAHTVYDSLVKNCDDEARMWAAIWVYELVISPRELRCVRWATEEGGEVVAQFLGDFETRRVEINAAGAPVRWSDLPDVEWPEGDRCVLSDQALDVDAALQHGATLSPWPAFLAAWAEALASRPHGTPNPRIAAASEYTFEELRIARGELPVRRRLELELAPKAHVTTSMVQAIQHAFDTAGVPIAAWTTMRGDASFTQPADRVAEATLETHLLTDARSDPDDEVAGMAAGVSAALASVREELPHLPLGLRVVTGQGTRLYAFRPTDSSDEIRAGLAQLPAHLDVAPAVLGWDSAVSGWIGL